MRNILIGTAVAAALSLAGMSARAGCMEPKSSTQHSAILNLEGRPMPNHLGHDASDNIVGTWYVAYTTAGAPSGEAFIQWHSDGTEWENINFPVLDGNLCMGSWKTIDQSRVYRNHYGWLYNNGLLAGWFNETQTDQCLGTAIHTPEPMKRQTVFRNAAAGINRHGNGKAPRAIVNSAKTPADLTPWVCGSIIEHLS